ncbi:MAG: hypothetical protein WC375_06150 [Methanomassiliicoccales archaeon]|jgi:hypothetical protein
MHDILVERYCGGMSDLVKDISNLRYDVLARFLWDLGDKIECDAKEDEARSRVKLSHELSSASDNLRKASEDIQQAWTICEPRMKDPKFA